ncbi:MAG: neutral zinc metallopeptidase [Planctomycetales bacterium]
MVLAKTIGDHCLQIKSRAITSRQSYTPATSVQRIKWCRRGLHSGDLYPMNKGTLCDAL